jgi:hypothetical protein
VNNYNLRSEFPLFGGPDYTWAQRNAGRQWTGPVTLNAEEVVTLYKIAAHDARVRSRYANWLRTPNEIIQCLVGLGFVSGEPHPHDSHKRGWRYSITPAGLAWLESCRPVEVEKVEEEPHEPAAAGAPIREPLRRPTR